MRRSLPAIVFTTCLGLGLVGCGGDDTEVAADAAGQGGQEAGAGDGGGGGEVLDVCTLLTPADVETVLGGPVVLEEVPGGGCNFEQDDPRAPSVSLLATPLDEGNGGFDGASAGLTAVIEGEGSAVDVGDRAFLVVGPAMGGESEQGSGIVQVGSTLVQATLVQSVELSSEEVSSMLTGVLELVASQG